MATIRDVAKQAGVGVGTVSRALNGTGHVSPETKKKIEDAASKLGYTPNELARNLFRNRTGIIGLIVPDLHHSFFSCFAKYVEMELYKQGYKTMICNSIGISDREKEYLYMLERNMVDGIITAAHSLDGEEYLKQKKPIVSLDRDFGSQIPLIGSDHAKGGRMAAELLIKNGCKKILQISGVSPNVASNDRHTAFQQIVESSKIELLNFNMDWNVFEWNAYYEQISNYMEQHPDIDGVFSGDMGAIVCMNWALQRGISIPEQLKIIGFDAMDITQMTYPVVTAVKQDVPLLAELCVNTLLDLIEERKHVPHRQILDVEMQYGGTTLSVE